VAQHVEQAACGRTALCEVVGLRRVDLALPEVGVGFCEVAVVDAGELAVDAEGAGWRYAGAGGGFGVEGPAVGVGDELVALEGGGGRWGGRVWGEEEEDVVRGYG
jgi:hypothetical protein